MDTLEIEERLLRELDESGELDAYVRAATMPALRRFWGMV